jgi:hypothetical protein
MGRNESRVDRLERTAEAAACGDQPCLKCSLAAEPIGNVEAAKKRCNGRPHDFDFVEALQRLVD